MTIIIVMHIETIDSSENEMTVTMVKKKMTLNAVVLWGPALESVLLGMEDFND